ncbi:lens fiber membrane intrinsic protein-like isoform X1 [Xenopus laevis]|uniref:Lens fiber membrane intrinsic protein-like isoform X1 n=1 Tax=Xenopus laevis TaxID=8355 RepID=A0A8J1L7Y6_XENLA|nr:lens fiber membrane intrinsic protein-like isoform X1 [Xenopus laevis]
MYRLHKGIILLLILGSSLLALIAMITDYWAIIPSTSQHMGLFRICNKHKTCYSLLGTDSPKYLLISVFVIGMLLLPCGILEVFYASSGRLGCLKCVGVISCLQVILTFSGLISATVLLSSFLKTETFYFSWSFALGWLAVIVAAAQVALSFYINKIEPPSPAPTVTGIMGTLHEIQVAVIPVS